MGSAAGSIISFLLLPLYTKFLTPEDYGYLTVFTVIQSVVEITGTFGLSSGLFRYYLMAEEEIEKRKVINTCFWTQLIFVIIIFAIFSLLSKQISILFFGTIYLARYCFLVASTGLMSACGGFVFSYMRAERKPYFFVIVQLIKMTLLAIVNIYFVAILHKSYKGIIIGNFGVSLLILLFVFLWFAKFVNFYFSFKFLKRLLIFITPIYIVNVFFFILNLSDRLFLNYFLSAKDLGLYSFGSKIGSIVMLGVITPFSTAIIPYALSIAKEDNFRSIYAKIIKYFVLIVASFSLYIFYFSNEIVLIVSNKEYGGSSGIIGPILLSGIFYGLYYNLSIALDIIEKTYYATIVVIVGALVSVAFNYFTIPLLGMYGSALASCVSNGVLFMLMYFFCQKHYPIHYEVAAFLKLIGILILYILFYYCVEFFELKLGYAILVKSTLIFLFPFSLYWIHILDSKERRYCLNFIRKKSNIYVVDGNHIS